MHILPRSCHTVDAVPVRVTGVCKPAILTVIDEIISAGIEKVSLQAPYTTTQDHRQSVTRTQIVVIVRRDYLAYFEKLFHQEVFRTQ